MTKIGLIDYKVGNIKSLINSFYHLGCKIEIIDDPNKIKLFDKILLPGVGNFDYAIKQLKELKFIDELNEYVFKEKLILGICLGMQLMCKSSDESKSHGLGWIDAEVIDLKKKIDKKFDIPHIGWNTVSHNEDIDILNNIPSKSDFYFVHSYGVFINERIKVTKTSYGIEFNSAFQKKNIYGVQFHPEKSHKMGLRLIENFIKK